MKQETCSLLFCQADIYSHSKFKDKKNNNPHTEGNVKQNQNVHQDLVSYPSCVPEKVGINQKGINKK
jgi:hypothetical protein